LSVVTTEVPTDVPEFTSRPDQTHLSVIITCPEDLNQLV